MNTKKQGPRRYRWSREWVILGTPHLDYLDRIATTRGVTPSAIVRELVEQAMLGDRHHQDDAERSVP